MNRLTKPNPLRWVFITCIPLIFASCFSFSNFQTARTLGKGNTEFGGNLSYLGGGGAIIGLPLIEIGGKYGVAENVDLGLRLGNIGNIMIDSKFQFYGTKESSFAAATGLSVGGSFIGFSLDDNEGIGFFQYEIPLHLSTHPSDKFAVYFTPRYMGIGGSGSGETSLSHLFIFSPGMEFGNKLKFGVNFNIIKPIDEFFDSSILFTFGLGLKYQF